MLKIKYLLLLFSLLLSCIFPVSCGNNDSDASTDESLAVSEDVSENESNAESDTESEIYISYSPDDGTEGEVSLPFIPFD